MAEHPLSDSGNPAGFQYESNMPSYVDCDCGSAWGLVYPAITYDAAAREPVCDAPIFVSGNQPPNDH
jgi:hypothetical protein